MPVTPRAWIEESPIYKRIPDDREKQTPPRVVYEDEHNHQVLGAGGDRVVIEDGDEAIALKYSGGLYKAMATYYTQRILHTLYPNNFPQFRAVYYDQKQGVNVEFRKRIDYETGYEQELPDILYIDEVSEQLSDMGIMIQRQVGAFGGELLFPESNNTGLVKDTEGNQYEVFLDAVNHTDLHLREWDFEKIFQKMTEKGYRKSQIVTVLNAAIRIAIHAQEKVDRLKSGEEDDMVLEVPFSNVLSQEQIEQINNILSSLELEN